MKNKIIGILLMAFLLVVACRKDNSITDTQITTPGPIITILSQVSGFVTDTQGTALPEATVWLGSNSSTTDENGYFSISGYANEEGAILKVELMGYFANYHAVQPFEGETARTTIQLTERNAPAQITTTSGGAIPVNGGGKVTFASNSFVDSEGNPYSGTVNIYSTYIDPTMPDLEQVMPGDLRALNVANEPRLLESFGMINVELEGENGEALQITENAVIEVPVPATLTSNAPATIPLWYFDEATGLWIEEGEATLQNGIYVGEVRHFTFWNCDVPWDFIDISGEIKAGIYSPEVSVRITRISNGDARSTTTTDKGKFSGAVPNNELLLLEVLSRCGVVVYSEQIGPFLADQDLGEIEIDLSSDNWVQVSGTLSNCDQQAVENGYVLILPNNTQATFSFPVQEDGQFTGLISACDATTLSILAFDIDASKSEQVDNIAVNSMIDVGTIQVCTNEIIPSVVFTLNGVEYTINGCTASLQSDIALPPLSAISLNFSESFDSGSVDYSTVIVNWTQDLENPVFGLSSQYVQNGTPDAIYTFLSDSDGMELLLVGTEPGEFIIFRANNATIKNEITQEEFTNCTITYTAIITE